MNVRRRSSPARSRPAYAGRRSLTASAGVSVNKMLAKIASDYRKPDGLFTIAPSEVEAFVAALPVERFFGIGAVTAERMHRMGIHTGADLRQWDEAALVQRFGKAGHAYYGYARGVDEREVEPHRVRKSVGAETTFAEDTDDRTRLSMEPGGRARGGVEPHSASRVPGQDRRAETQIRRLPPDHPIEDALHGHRLRRSALPRIGGACSRASISTAARCGSSASRWATRPKPVPTACSCASTSARSDRFVGARRSIVSRTFSLYLYPYRTDYSGVLLLSLLLGLCPCEKEENVGEVIPPADQGQSTVVCTKSRASYWKGAATGCAGLTCRAPCGFTCPTRSRSGCSCRPRAAIDVTPDGRFPDIRLRAAGDAGPIRGCIRVRSGRACAPVFVGSEP